MSISTKLFPIAPAAPVWGAPIAFPVLNLPVAASATIQKGDAIIYSSGLLAEAAAGANAKTVLGFSAQALTTSGSVTVADKLQIYPALPGALFEGHAVTDATSDYTLVQALFGVPIDLVIATASDSASIHCLDQGTSSDGLFLPLYPARQISGTQGWDGIGTVNPRVVFAVTSSLFAG